ncbi:MAG: glycosyltransferase [Oscillospiraceae bacterium]|jgi:glycosyltransferase involved in cell wall biosynthesis|nr:glycosyltransferase [Oscillospiraceae bacterium]
MKLKIALFNESFPPFIDGVSMTVKNYADIINEKLGEAFVVTPYLRGVYDDYPYKVIRYSSIPSTNAKIQYPIGNPMSFTSIHEIRREKPDLIHVHSPFSGSVLARMCAINNDIPVVLTYHTKFDQDIDTRLINPQFRQIAKNFVRVNVSNADEVWSVSNGCGGALRTIGYKGIYRVMENGADYDRRCSSPEEIAKINEEWGLEPDEKLLLFVGRMHWYKNIKLILDAVRKAHLAGNQFKAIFVGNGGEFEDIKAYAKRLGASSYVYFAGAVREREKLRAYYSRANLLLFPSTYDTSGLVVKEAAACDTPALLIRGSCAAEGVEDGFSGFLCEDNLISCTDVLINALSNSTRLASIGKNAGRYVYLSWEDSIRKAYARYEEIVTLWNNIPQINRRRMYKKVNERLQGINGTLPKN